VVGLGNPGSAYEGTRHNVGFAVVDACGAAWRFPAFRRPWRWRARVSEGLVENEPVRLVKPQTYMNRSGTALGPLLAVSDFDPEADLLVVVDDVALPLGRMRLRRSGSAGGHNGLKSVAGRLASNDWARLRVGVGPVPADEDQSDFVLSRFETGEQEQLDALMPDLVAAVECWITEGIDTAMNRFNRRGVQSD